MPLDVRPITRRHHRAFVEERSASFLQLPLVGRGQGRVGSALARLVRRRPARGRRAGAAPPGAQGGALPRVPARRPGRRLAAYDATDVLDPLTRGAQGAQGVRREDGPAGDRAPVVVDHHQGRDRSRQRTTARRPHARRENPRPRARRRAARPRAGGRSGHRGGLRRRAAALRLPGAAGRRSPSEVFAGFNQLWRRNVRRPRRPASRSPTAASGRPGRRSTRVYVVTARRDDFTPRPLAYFQRMWDGDVGRGP